MTKLSLTFSFSLLALILVTSPHPASSAPLSETFGVETTGQSLLLKIKKHKNKPLNCKKAKCGPGEIKLSTPSVYGACCQAAGTEVPQAKPAGQACKFGQIGTYPDCECPKGTEFAGYKGCVPKLTQLCRQMVGVNANISSFKAAVSCKGNASCNPIGGDGDKQLCCCDVQIVD
jgi:hypothetical protein